MEPRFRRRGRRRARRLVGNLAGWSNWPARNSSDVVNKLPAMVEFLRADIAHPQGTACRAGAKRYPRPCPMQASRASAGRRRCRRALRRWPVVARGAASVLVQGVPPLVETGSRRSRPRLLQSVSERENAVSQCCAVPRPAAASGLAEARCSRPPSLLSQWYAARQCGTCLLPGRLDLGQVVEGIARRRACCRFRQPPASVQSLHPLLPLGERARTCCSRARWGRSTMSLTCTYLPFHGGAGGSAGVGP